MVIGTHDQIICISAYSQTPTKTEHMKSAFGCIATEFLKINNVNQIPA